MAIAFETTNDIDCPPSLDSFARKSAEDVFRHPYPAFGNTSLLDDLRTTESDRTYPSVEQNEVNQLNHYV